MSEFITIQVGQCGNQIGSAFWPLVLQEYGIQNVPGGVKDIHIDKKMQNEVQSSFQSFFTMESCAKDVVFNDLSTLAASNVKARVILVDMEDSVIARFRTGPLRSIIDENFIVTNYPGSGNNWAEGFCSHGPRFKNEFIRKVREVAEKCDSLHGFIVMFSVGGGTGSGLGTYILKLLADYFSLVERFVICVYPTGTEDVITCPYNMGFSTEQLIKNASCVFPVENRALLDIVTKQLNNKHSLETINYVHSCRPFHDMNSIIANMLLHLTCGARFRGSLNLDINEISTNMVPFANLNFLASGFSPMTVSSTKNFHQATSKQIKKEMFLASCHRSNQLLKINQSGPRSVLLGTTLIGRGDYTLLDMREYVEKLQSRARFTPWSIKAMKIGLCSMPPRGHSAAFLSLFNTSAMADLFHEVGKQFRMLYDKKAHIHHYTEVPGFEEERFLECYETLTSTINTYEEIESVRPLNVPRLQPFDFS